MMYQLTETCLYFVALRSSLCHHSPPFNCSPLFSLARLLFVGEVSSPYDSPIQRKRSKPTYHCPLTDFCQGLKRLRLGEWAEPHQPISGREISMASELRIQEREKITPNTPNMANVTEHPFRVKRRKLDEGSQGNQDVTFTSSAQLRGALAFQQNPQLANKGESGELQPSCKYSD